VHRPRIAIKLALAAHLNNQQLALTKEYSNITEKHFHWLKLSILPEHHNGEQDWHLIPVCRLMVFSPTIFVL
jgi:hypothetical protein